MKLEEDPKDQDVKTSWCMFGSFMCVINKLGVFAIAAGQRSAQKKSDTCQDPMKTT